MAILASLCWMFFVTPAGYAVAAEFSDAQKRGEAVVQRWCRDCHVQAGQPHESDLAPPFENIVQRPGRTMAYLRNFFDEDHFPMPTYRLFAAEKDDLVAYLESLR